MSVGPPRLHCITPDQIESKKLKAFVVIIHIWPQNAAEHIGLAATRGAWTGAPQQFEFQK
jgi:hypothetical protein